MLRQNWADLHLIRARANARVRESGASKLGKLNDVVVSQIGP